MLRKMGVIALTMCAVGSGAGHSVWAQNLPDNGSPGMTPPTLGAPPALHGNGAASPSQQLAVATPAPGGAAFDTNEYRLGAGDHVRINVFGQPDLSGIFTVDGAGNLSFPLIGSLRAGGMTATDLQQALYSRLSPNYIKQPSIAVEIQTYRPFYILGEVRAPGSYPFVSGMTALQAIAIAGGFTYRAREGEFEVTRNGPNGSKEHIDVTPDTTIDPGDIITVNERYF
jgi:protein involved in polysaccharide export with SLBB domain